MRIKGALYKIILFATAAVFVGGLTILLIAANKKDTKDICTGINIEVLDAGSGEGFINKDDVRNLIETAAHGSIIDRSVSSLNLPELEKTLETHKWIKDAQIYFDSKNILNISIEERKPFVRVFTTEGNSFYIDKTGAELPLLNDNVFRLPVVTSFPATRKRNKKDSALVKEINVLVDEIQKQSFWNAQVGSIDITSDGFHLIPTLGDHVIKIGNTEDLQQKLDRLFIFYKQVLSKTGLNKYAVLDARFKGQIVAQKKGSTIKSDDLQLQKNIEELMVKKELQKEQNTIITEVQDEHIGPVIKPVKEEIKALRTNSVPVKANVPPIKTKSPAAKSEQKTIEQKKEVKKPKAVMKKVEQKTNDY